MAVTALCVLEPFGGGGGGQKEVALRQKHFKSRGGQKEVWGGQKKAGGGQKKAGPFPF